MADWYSLTIWNVKAGREDEFERRWKAFAEWSELEGLSARATLLRDVDRPGRFVSFGPWETVEAIARWRTLPGFHEHVALLTAIVDRFEPSTLESVLVR